MLECLRLSPLNLKTEKDDISESEMPIAKIDFENFVSNKFAFVQNDDGFFCYFIDLKEQLKVIKVSEAEVENLMLLNENVYQ